MASTSETKSKLRQTNSKQGPNVNGVFNWTLLLLLSLCLNLIIENYIRYGIIKTPVDIINIFFEFLYTTRWSIFVYFIGCQLQTIFCYLIENSLATGVLSERTGITLHILNSLLVLNLIFIIFTFYVFSPAACFYISSVNIIGFFKILSYIAVNRVHRLEYQKRLKEGEEIKMLSVDKTAIKYPENVTLKNAYLYLFGTSIFTYKLYLKTSERNMKMAFYTLLKFFVVLFVVAFMCYQYIHPYCKEVLTFLETQQYLKASAVACKILIPSSICHFLFLYVIMFHCMMPFTQQICGTEVVTLHEDWWNTYDSNTFWKKWNLQTHLILKNVILKPILEAGYSRLTAAMAVGLISGIAHEFMFTVSVRTLYGFATVQMTLIAIMGTLSSYLRYFNKNFHNAIIFLYLSSGQIFFPVCATYYIHDFYT